jgi:ferredoxin
MQTLEHGYVNAGFLLLVLLVLATLVFGRFFCGWACHVVAYQDASAWLLRKAGLKPRPLRSRVLRLAPLGAALYMFLWPQVARLLRGDAFPVLTWHLGTDSLWETFPGPGTALLTFVVDGFLVIYLLGAKGFCTYGCPYGAIFGLAERGARGRIRVTDACEGCGHCTATCTSNVRVHEEVARFGMVVDPGCMKCMDCVSVCPKDALYYGFAARGRARPRRRSRRAYDFSWPEEVLLGAGFLAALYAFRGLYNRVPFLLSLGLAAIVAVLLLAGLRLLRERSFSYQHVALRCAGRWTAAGVGLAVLVTSTAALTVHSTLVQYHTREGERLLEVSQAAGAPGDPEALARAARHLTRAERLGLLPDGKLHNLLGVVLRDLGELAGAESHLRRALEIDPTEAKLLALSTLELQQGDLEGARQALLDVLQRDPETGEAQRRLGILEERAREDP